MADVGSETNYVDYQGKSLTNSTDSKTYVKLQNLVVNITRKVKKHQLTDGSVFNSVSLYMNSLEGNLILTSTEWVDLVALTATVDGQLPIKVWSVAWTDNSGNVVTTSFNGQLLTLSPESVSAGVIKLPFRIEADEAIAVVVT